MKKLVNDTLFSVHDDSKLTSNTALQFDYAVLSSALVNAEEITPYLYAVGLTWDSERWQ